MEKKTKRYLLGALLLSPLALLLPTSTKVSNAQFANKDLPRGLRNNNPGNLRKTDNKWLGKVSNPLDPEFESFDTLSNGLRAALRNAFTQWNRGKDSIEALVSVWAPPSENATSAYVAKVAKEVGISPGMEFKWGNNETTAKIMFAIFKHENGPQTSKYITLASVKSKLAELWPAK